MDKRNAVLIYAKWPRLGECKTRIARDTSDEFAYKFSVACLNDLIGNLKNSDFFNLVAGVNTRLEAEKFDKTFGMSSVIVQSRIRDKRLAQSEKFHNIFSSLLRDQSYRNAILIPMDLPFLKSEDIITAFTRLQEKPFVVGPESNGGIYLIGVRRPYSRNVFENVSWSSSHSARDLISNCGARQTYVLNERADLNTFQDVMKTRKGIANHCPSVHKVLVNAGYGIGENRYVDFDSLPLNIPVVSAIVQKRDAEGIKVLLQTRHKPSIDPENTGKLEIPAGIIERYELAHHAIKREVKEETGLTVRILNAGHTEKNGGEAVAYSPFCCAQQLTNGRAHLGLTFICSPTRGKLKEKYYETRNPHWVSLGELDEILTLTPEKVFSFHIPSLRKYLEFMKSR